MYNNKYELNVAINGKPVREHYQNGKFFIEARPNSEYSIKLKNHSYKRIMAVFSVDGIDVLKGGKASEAQSGYIVNPYSHVVINGYRIDDNNVATFKFDDGKQSYSTQVEYEFDAKKIEKVQKGQLAPSKNNGVIAVRVWEEKDSVIIPNWKTKKQKMSRIQNTSYYTSLASGFSLQVSGYSPQLYAFSGAPVTTGNYGGPQGSVGNNGPVGRGGLSAGASGPISYSSNIYYNANTTSDWDGTVLCSYSNTDNSVEDNNSVGINNYTPNFSLGTSWGEQVQDKILKIDFEKTEIYIDLVLFYLERTELINLGIDLENNKQVFISEWPQPFEEELYCKKPLNWRKA